MAWLVINDFREGKMNKKVAGKRVHGAEYSLRAHLILSISLADGLIFQQVLELGCYLQSAWEASCLEFKKPPQALARAKRALTDCLDRLALAECCPVSPAQWLVLKDGVVCADGVWHKVRAGHIGLINQSLRSECGLLLAS